MLGQKYIFLAVQETKTTTSNLEILFSLNLHHYYSEKSALQSPTSSKAQRSAGTTFS